MTHPRLVLLGRQGAGKGTQAAFLTRHYGIPHIATGDILRAAVRAGTEFGAKAKEYMDAGELLPDDIMTGVVVERLEQEDARDGFLLDGFPRTVTQAGSLEAMAGPVLDLAINLTVPRSVVLERLVNRRVCRTCGRIYSTTARPSTDWVCDTDGGDVVQRDDDKADAINHRLDVYDRQTAPLIPWYDERDLLVTVDGTGPTAEVSARLVDAVDGRLSRVR